MTRLKHAHMLHTMSRRYLKKSHNRHHPSWAQQTGERPRWLRCLAFSVLLGCALYRDEPALQTIHTRHPHCYPAPRKDRQLAVFGWVQGCHQSRNSICLRATAERCSPPMRSKERTLLRPARNNLNKPFSDLHVTCSIRQKGSERGHSLQSLLRSASEQPLATCSLISMDSSD